MAFDTISRAMKYKPGIRVTFNDKWMIWCDSRKHWEVYQQKKRQKYARLLLSINSKSKAINGLVDL